MSIENISKNSLLGAVPDPPSSLLDCTPDQLIPWLQYQGEAPYRAAQILKWVHRRLCSEFHQMTDLSKPLRQRLATHFRIPLLDLVQEQRAQDGTRKFLFQLADGHHIETVLIPERNHATLCVSSQVGCALGCRFCSTARAGLERNLSPGEIVAQVRQIRQISRNGAGLTNIVFMGMGEPLANYANLIQALTIITDPAWGMAFSPRRVTVSTAGLAPRLADLGRDSAVNLAVSLNAVDDDTRTALMPINATYPLDVLIQACRDYPLRPHRRITFEYILIDGVNDAPTDARRLAKLLRPIRAKINLIPFNPHPESDFTRPGDDAIAAFQQILIDGNYTTIIRNSKGVDIAAACGQLRADLYPQR